MAETNGNGAKLKYSTNRRSQSQQDGARLMYERRPLKTITLVPPDYQIPTHVLLESHIEKEVKFAGIIPDIPRYLDATNRTDVLRVIDRGKREKKIPWKLTLDHDSIFSLSIHNVKISNRAGDEALLLRLPIHQVEAMCYIKDDDSYVLCIKFDDPEYRDEMDAGDTCQLAVLYCDSRGAAEELCSLMSQCFQLVYTEATIQFLDTKVREAAADMSIGSSTIRSERSYSKSTSRLDKIDSKNLGFLSQSSLDLEAGGGGNGVHNATSTVSSGTSRSLPRRSSSATNRSESDNGTTYSTVSEQLLTDYMNKLYNKLNPDELRRFAMLVKAWHSNMPFKEFCDKVLDLYGPDRKHLLIGMRPFIPEKDSQYFEAFLDRIGLSTAAMSGMQSVVTHATTGTMSSGFGSRVYNRGSYSATSFHSVGANVINPSSMTLGVTGTGTGLPETGDDYDRMLSDITTNIENLGSNMDLSGGPEPDYLPKST